MKATIVLALGMGLVWAVAAPVNASAEDAKAAPKTSPVVVEAAAKARESRIRTAGLADEEPKAPLTISGKPVFVPPNRGTPVARVGGAARAMSRLPGIEALVPLESGLTLEPQPVLYWYLSEATDLPVNFTLIDLDVEVPLLDLTLEGPFEKGVHRIRLEDHTTSLTQGRMYQWFVALVPDPEDRSSDRLAGGGIERVDSKLWLAKRLREASADQLPIILSGAGVWYDALNLLSERIDQLPGDPEPVAQRQALFQQVGLEVILAE